MQDELLKKFKIEDRSDPRWILLVTPVQNVSVHRAQKTEGVRCFASEGVTTEDHEVRHDMTGWTDY